MTDKAYVPLKPFCDFHPEVTADYDGKTVMGPWANMCTPCFERQGVGLGTGRGQRYVVGVKPRESYRADMTMDEIEDMVGDGDILDFI